MDVVLSEDGTRLLHDNSNIQRTLQKYGQKPAVYVYWFFRFGSYNVGYWWVIYFIVLWLLFVYLIKVYENNVYLI